MDNQSLYVPRIREFHVAGNGVLVQVKVPCDKIWLDRIDDNEDFQIRLDDGNTIFISYELYGDLKIKNIPVDEFIKGLL